MRRNGQPMSNWDGALARPTVVFFAPDSLQLIKGGPAQRRSFLDSLLAQMFPAYMAHISRFNTAVSQRNDLLKNLRTNRSSKALLEAWNEQLVTEAVPIFARRQEVIEALQPYAKTELFALSADEELQLHYKPGLPDGQCANWQQAMLQALEEHVDEEIARGHSLFGPHRDDVDIMLSGRAAKAYASQGQQRSIALALSLAQERLLTENTGLEPILLLDDIFSELDHGRRERLLKLLSEDRQAVLTTTDADDLVQSFALQGLNLLRVEEGAVHAE